MRRVWAAPWLRDRRGGGLEGPGRRRGVVAALCLQRGAWRGGEEDDSGWVGWAVAKARWASPVAPGKRFLSLFLFSFLTFVLFS